MIQSSLAAAALEQEGIEESLAKRSDTGKSPIKGAPKPKTVKTSVRFSDILRQAKEDAVVAAGTPSVVPPMPFDTQGTVSTTYGTQIPAPTARNRSGAEAAQFQALTGRTQTQWNIDFDPNSLEAIMAEWDRKNIGRVTRGFDVPKEAQSARDQFRSHVAQQMAAPPTMKQRADQMVSGMTEWQPPEVSLQGFGESMTKLAPSGLAQAGRIQIGKMIGFSDEDIADMESRGETHALDMLADIAGGLAAMGAGGGGAIGAFGKVMAASDVAQGIGLAGIAANPVSEAVQGRPGQLQEMGGAFAQSLNPFENGISPLEKTARGVSTALLMLGGVAGVAALKRAHLAKRFESMGASAKEAADLALSVEQRLRMLETGSSHKTEPSAASIPVQAAEGGSPQLVDARRVEPDVAAQRNAAQAADQLPGVEFRTRAQEAAAAPENAVETPPVRPADEGVGVGAATETPTQAKPAEAPEAKPEPKTREQIAELADPDEQIEAILSYARARAAREASGEGPVNVASGFTEDDFFIASTLATAYVRKGVQTVKELVEKIVADLGEGFRPQAEEAAARVLGDQAASEFGRQAPKGARVPVGEGTRKVSNIEDSLNRFAGALGKTVFKDREKGRRLGSFRPSDTRVNIRNHGDLPTAAHELFHDADDAAGHSLAAAKEQWFQDQVLGRSEYRTSVPDRATPNVERAEAWAEFMTAYAMNPQKAAELSPDAVKWVESNLDAKTLSAVREFSEDVRGWHSMPATEKVAANVRFSKDDPKPGVRKLVKTFFDGTDESGQWHPSGWDKARALFTNDATVVEQAVREQMRRAGKSELAPSKDPIGLISDNRYLAQKVDSILEHGMVDSKGDRVTGPIAEMFDSLDTSSGKSLEDDLRGAFSYMISQRHAERAAKIRNATDERLKGLIEGLESGGKTIESNGTTYTRSEAQRIVDAARKNDQSQIDSMTGVGRGIEGDEGIHSKALEEVEADPERKARYDAFAQRYRDWADSLLRYSVENGYLSKTDYDRIKSSNEFYVAFAREGFEDMAHPQKGASSLTQGSGLFQTLEGSTREIKDPFASILAMTHKVVREVDRNSVLKSIYDLAARQPREFQGDGRVDTSALFRVVDEGTEGAVRVRVDGKDKYLWMAPEVRESFDAMGKVFQKLPFDPVQIAASIQRNTITIVPAFATRNFLRDVQQRILVSNVGSGLFLPSKAQARLRKEELEMFYGQYGAGIGRSHYMDGPKEWGQVQKAMMAEMTKRGTIVPGNPWKAYKNLIGKSEMKGRLMEFEKAYGVAKGKGLSDHEARLFAAREARGLIDFMRAGTTTRLLNRYIPFLNAGVQGSAAMWTSAKRNPKRFAARLAATAIAPSVANYLLVQAMGDLEEYRNLPSYQRDLFYNVKVGDRWFSFPKAFESGVVAAFAERALDKAMGNDEALDGYAGSLLKSAIPFDPDWSTLGGGVKGFLEVRSNYDTFRDKPIKPPWDPGAIEGRDTTSASALGELLQKAFMNTQDARDIDHVIETQLGNVGRMATSASDVLTGERDGRDWLLQQTGLVRSRPVSNQKDAGYVAAKLKEFGVSGGTELKEYRALMSEAFKDEKAKTKFYAEAKRYREKIEKAIANNPNFEKRQEAIKSIFQSGGKKLAAG